MVKAREHSKFDRKVNGRHRSRAVPCHFLKLPPNYSYVFRFNRWAIFQRPGRRYKREADENDNKTLIKHKKVLSPEESKGIPQPPFPDNFKDNIDRSLWPYYGFDGLEGLSHLDHTERTIIEGLCSLRENMEAVEGLTALHDIEIPDFDFEHDDDDDDDDEEVNRIVGEIADEYCV